MYRLRPFFIALQFLTIFPVRLDKEPDENMLGSSLLYYPFIGLLIGILLITAMWGLSDAPALMNAAIILLLWVSITGALHLDGLADSADAWIGGLGDREKTLEIMKDPYCGPAAVVTLLLVLLIKFTALTQLTIDNNWQVILLVPVLGRTSLVLLFLTTPYVRSRGLGSMLAKYLSQRMGIAVIISVLIVSYAFLGIMVLGLLVSVVGLFFVLRQFMLRRLGGATGDTAGALVEMTEATALMAAVLIS